VSNHPGRSRLPTFVRRWTAAVAVGSLAVTSPLVAAAAAAGPAANDHAATHPDVRSSSLWTGDAGDDGDDPTARGRWSWRADPTGAELVWRSAARLPTMDSRLEFRVGDHVLGYPRVGADGRTLSLSVGSLGDVDPADVEVWVGLHRLDASTRTRTPAPPARTGRLAQQPVVPPGDPGEPGTFAVESFDYSAPALPSPGFEAPLDVLGHAVVPVGAERVPLVLFLHGRHAACHGPGNTGTWPCAGHSRPVPSYLGFDYLQRVLASQGYATVSIAANAVDAQDEDAPDDGMGARAALVNAHLALLTKRSADVSDPRWGGRLDPDRVVLVGHSRGGEGVDQAAIDRDPSAGYHLAGQVLIAPTSFGYQTAPGLPTEVLLGYCDGDVSDLQGQRYVDAAQVLDEHDPSLRSSVLLLGANHNFYNTEWTPGLSAAPSMDDWPDRADPVCGRRASQTRLTAAEQRRAATTFVAAGVHAFLGEGAEEALGYLDSGQPVAVPAAGPALAWTHALGGRRDTVRLGHGATVAGAGEACLAGKPSDATAAERRSLLCGADEYARQVHWTQAGRSPATVEAAYAATGLPQHLRMSWTTPGTEGGFALTRTLDLSAADSVLDLRTVVRPGGGPVQLQVVLGSAGAMWAGPVTSLSALPGSRALRPLWAQTLRVDPADYRGRLDLAHVDTVLLRAVSPAGQVWVLDASRRGRGLDVLTPTTLPRLVLGRVTVAEGDTGAGAVAGVPFRVLGEVSSPARFAVAMERGSPAYSRRPRYGVVRLRPGQTSGTIPVRYRADDHDDLPRRRLLVHAVAKHGVVVSLPVGSVVLRDDDPPPTVTFAPVRRRVHYGAPLVFRLTLGTPVDYYVFNLVGAVRSHRLPLRTSDVPRRWLRAELGPAPPDVPLARVWHTGFLDLPPGARHARLTVPTVADPLHPAAKALTVRFTAPQLTSPLRATAQVLPRK
jgi:hypothetical protein